MLNSYEFIKDIRDDGFGETDEYFDEFEKYIKETFKPSEAPEVSVINPTRIKEMIYVYYILKYLTEGMDVNIVHKTHRPIKSMGSITVSGKNISFKNPGLFIRAVAFATNFEAYAKLDGTVEMVFTFHDLTKCIE